MILIFLAFLTPSAVLTIEKPPHVVLILADDVGWADTSLVGGYQIPTPNMDALAAHGVLLTQHYSMQTCTPSRAALLTGLYPIRMGLQHDVLLPAQPGGVNLSVPTLAERLKDLGYKTHALGKPLFMYMATLAAHGETTTRTTDAPERNLAKFPYIGDRNRTLLAGTVDALDEAIGRIVEALHSRGMLANSVIVFTSDNGGIPWGVYSNTGSNWPLRGVKGTLWEGGIRVPAIVWEPATPARLPRRSAPTRSPGGNVGDLGTIDGLDLWPVLSAAKSESTAAWPRSEFLINIDTASGLSGYRDGNHKLIVVTSPKSSEPNPFDEEALQQHVPVPGGAPEFESEGAAVEYLDLLMKSSLAWKTLEELYGDGPCLAGSFRRLA
ncbi:hypothetical protein MTO96_046310 [Rhipicephalus appendiculatus]